MTALLTDPNGQGGGGGGLAKSDGAKTASGSVELADVPTGKYDLLVVCSGTGIVHFAASASGSRHVLAASDVACGATLRLPVTLTSKGIVLKASSSDSSAQWWASIATPHWEPSPTDFSN